MSASLVVETSVQSLAQLRQEMEATGVTLCELTLPSVLLLADVCDALGLDARARRAVLGDEAIAWLEAWANTSVFPNHLPVTKAVALSLP